MREGRSRSPFVGAMFAMKERYVASISRFLAVSMEHMLVFSDMIAAFTRKEEG